ncbi:beta-N-acetylhexosaminidase [Neotamlana laminarinivorans]|uniref:beta-N-acetylhexosaminidase n=1 Tax=Neotamlana laminarinivorans TaxID=2883124 RepID=A0A9X1HXB3_9FLAO|nr:family 20 glycosylhydrolase [Tamlana laminarinivorans]MCB4797873.1 family 20 glycosylhydrolase [Tamlana laminarinivorans]
MNYKNYRKLTLIFLSFFIISSCKKEVPKTLLKGKVSIIPLPKAQNLGEGFFILNEDSQVSVENESQLKIASHFFELIEESLGFSTEVKIQNTGANIQFFTDASLPKEGYQLIVSQEKIILKASQEQGFFYGLQTLKQLFPPSFHNINAPENIEWGIPVVTINDEPEFKWRGYMLDVSRHFFDKEKIKEVLDFMSELKLNRFHWHLADDQGWRIEIKKFPKLTEVGAWRVDYNTTDETVSNWWGRPKQKPGEKATYGGFYTQEDIKEIVAYAKQLQIEIIPEIDMPGHSMAAITAYPEISCAKQPFYVATGGIVNNNTYCPAKEKTYQFIEGVLTEVMDLFPYKYIHIGGDECNKDAWKNDLNCKQLMKDENLANMHELQSYFIKRVEKNINAHGKNMIGWDEILEGGLAPNATVMSWRGEKGGIAAAKQGHDVVMTPFKYCYLDLKQGDDDLEPNLGYSHSFLKDTYNYKVISDSLTIDDAKHILGVQGNLWTESISDWSKLTYMTFPRLYAVAENGWTSQKLQNWDNFIERLLYQFKKLEAQETRYATSAFNVKINHEGHPKAQEIEVSLETEVDGLDIYYTTDGSLPTEASIKYTTPFVLKETKTVKATAYKNNTQVANISQQKFPIHKGCDAKLKIISKGNSNANRQKLTDLNYAKLVKYNENWVTINDDFEAVLNFKEETEVSHVDITWLRFTIGCVYSPENIEVLGSLNGKDYSSLSNLNQLKISHTQGRNKIESNLSFKATSVKFLKIKAKRVNPIPKEHHCKDVASKLMLDEIVVY